MTKALAEQIWYSICNHSDGFSEDFNEWCYNLGFNPDDVDNFIEWVDLSIAELK